LPATAAGPSRGPRGPPRGGAPGDAQPASRRATWSARRRSVACARPRVPARAARGRGRRGRASGPAMNEAMSCVMGLPPGALTAAIASPAPARSPRAAADRPRRRRPRPRRARAAAPSNARPRPRRPGLRGGPPRRRPRSVTPGLDFDAARRRPTRAPRSRPVPPRARRPASLAAKAPSPALLPLVFWVHMHLVEPTRRQRCSQVRRDPSSAATLYSKVTRLSAIEPS